MEDREIRAYLAGFFDGEGCITRSHSAPALTISNSAVEPIRAFKDYFGFGSISVKKFPPEKGYLDSYRWDVSGRYNVKKVLNALEPYLIVKKNKAIETLEWISNAPYTLRSAGCNWTAEEEEILKAKYYSASKEELMSSLPRRSWDAIIVKGKKMGLRRKATKVFFKNRRAWSESEIESLKNNFGKLDCKKLADSLGRSLYAVYKKARKLGLTGKLGIKYGGGNYFGQDSPD
jgi:hypothetical protein